jgi:hypothetical protein
LAKAGRQIILYASIFQAGRLTLLGFLLSNCVSPFPLSGPFMSRRIITHPKNNIKAELAFSWGIWWRNGDIYCAECTAPACFIVCVGKISALAVIEKDWLPRGY